MSGLFYHVFGAGEDYGDKGELKVRVMADAEPKTSLSTTHLGFDRSLNTRLVTTTMVSNNHLCLPMPSCGSADGAVNPLIALLNLLSGMIL